jgi:site-specific DNA-cytosine methylase
MSDATFTALFPFGGSAGGAIGFMGAEARLLGRVGRFECLGSIDNDPIACEDFERFTGTPAWCVDVRNITAREIIARYGAKAPHAVFGSPPCKGSSRLITQTKANTAKYVAMNELALVWTRAMLEAWADDPPALYMIENVNGLPQRAAGMLRELRAMLRKRGYVFHARSHDAGELGGLAQHRDRYLLVARHPKKCPSLLYQPPKRRVRGVGEELCKVPMPATIAAGAYGAQHTLPKLTWRNWVRLALIPAGGDWRDLEGVLQGRARREVFRRHAVQAWDQPAPAVTGPGGHSVESVADPRFAMPTRNWGGGNLNVTNWSEPGRTVVGKGDPASGGGAVSDPRFAMPTRDWGGDDLGVSGWADPGATVKGESLPRNGRFSVADPRFSAPESADWHENKLAVTAFDQPALTVIGKPQPSSGGLSVADLRVRTGYDAAYGVLRMDQPSRTVTGNTAPGGGANAVADDRERMFGDGVRILTLDEAMELDLDPGKAPPFIPVIVAEDGTWHRPMTLLELALLQGYPLVIRGAQLRFAGTRTNVAEHIGNAVPPPAARAIAEQMLIALVEEAEGTMLLRGDGAVWVQPTEARS